MSLIDTPNIYNSVLDVGPMLLGKADGTGGTLTLHGDLAYGDDIANYQSIECMGGLTVKGDIIARGGIVCKAGCIVGAAGVRSSNPPQHHTWNVDWVADQAGGYKMVFIVDQTPICHIRTTDLSSPVSLNTDSTEDWNEAALWLSGIGIVGALSYGAYRSGIMGDIAAWLDLDFTGTGVSSVAIDDSVPPLVERELPAVVIDPVGINPPVIIYPDPSVYASEQLPSVADPVENAAAEPFVIPAAIVDLPGMVLDGAIAGAGEELMVPEAQAALNDALQNGNALVEINGQRQLNPELVEQIANNGEIRPPIPVLNFLPIRQAEAAIGRLFETGVAEAEAAGAEPPDAGLFQQLTDRVRAIFSQDNNVYRINNEPEPEAPVERENRKAEVRRKSVVEQQNLGQRVAEVNKNMEAFLKAKNTYNNNLRLANNQSNLMAKAQSSIEAIKQRPYYPNQKADIVDQQRLLKAARTEYSRLQGSLTNSKSVFDAIANKVDGLQIIANNAENALDALEDQYEMDFQQNPIARPAGLPPRRGGNIQTRIPTRPPWR